MNVSSQLNACESKNNLGRNMLIGIIGGVLFGLLMLYIRTTAESGSLWRCLNFCLFEDITKKDAPHALGLFFIVGQLFIRFFQLIIIPLVFTSMVIAIYGVRNSLQLKRMSSRTFMWFMGTTLCAELVCIIISLFCIGFNIFPGDGTEICKVSGGAGDNPMLLFMRIMPVNILTALGNNQEIMCVIFLAIVLALAMRKRKAEGENIVLTFCQALNRLVMDILDFVVTYIAPTALFMLLSRTICSYGLGMLADVARYTAVCIGSLLAYLLVFYPLLIRFLTGMSPFRFLRIIWKVMLLTYSTCCSAVSLPLNIRTAVEELKVKPEVAQFVLPLGLTVNMDGTAIQMTIQCFFIAACGGYHVGLSGILMIILLSLLGSIGTPAVPGAAGIMMLSIITNIGVDNEVAMATYAVVLAVSRPIDMLVATLNAVGDTTVAVAVSRSMDKLAAADAKKLQ